MRTGVKVGARVRFSWIFRACGRVMQRQDGRVYYFQALQSGREPVSVCLFLPATQRVTAAAAGPLRLPSVDVIADVSSFLKPPSLFPCPARLLLHLQGPATCRPRLPTMVTPKRFSCLSSTYDRIAPSGLYTCIRNDSHLHVSTIVSLSVRDVVVSRDLQHSTFDDQPMKDTVGMQFPNKILFS